jgi:TRAP-type C4-dicarboxylate transport system permease small subunit
MSHTSHDTEEDTPTGRNPLERIAKLGVHVAAIILQVAAVGLVVNALYRYTIGGGFALITEASRFSLLIVVFLGLAGTHIVGGHVRVELFLSAIPARLRALLVNYIVPVVSIFYLSVLGWSGWTATAQMFANGTTTPSRPYILMWPIASVIPLGCGLLILILLLHLVRHVFRLKSDPAATQD